MAARSKLTPQQEKFARLLASGKTQADAYREAYPKSKKWAPEALHPEASRSAANPNISARVRELQQKAANTLEITLTKHLEDLAALREMAKDGGQFSAAVAAEVARGKAAGIYETKTRVTVQGLDWRGLLTGSGETE